MKWVRWLMCLLKEGHQRKSKSRRVCVCFEEQGRTDKGLKRGLEEASAPRRGPDNHWTDDSTHTVEASADVRSTYSKVQSHEYRNTRHVETKPSLRTNSYRMKHGPLAHKRLSSPNESTSY